MLLIDAESSLEEWCAPGHWGALLIADPNQTLITGSDPRISCGIPRPAAIAGRMQQWQAGVCSQLSKSAREKSSQSSSFLVIYWWAAGAVQTDVPCLHGRVVQELGQGVDFEFWGPSGKIHILPLQNCAVCRNTKNEWDQACVLEQSCFSPNASTACGASAVAEAEVRAASQSCCAVTLHELTLKHWKLPAVLAGVFFLGWYPRSALGCCLPEYRIWPWI